MYPVLFKIGNFAIYTYGALVFVGVLAAYLVSMREAKREGISVNVFSDSIFWLVIAGFIGARAVYIIVEFDAFLDAPLAIAFGRSGFVFYGGVILGGCSFAYFAQRNKLDFFKLADIVALSIPLGHAIGRLGCFFYGCCYGLASDSFFAMLFPPDSAAGLAGVKVIPTQLISFFFLLVIFVVLYHTKRKKHYPGQILLLYLLLYSVFRFAIEFFRGDPRGGILIFSTSQLIAVSMIIVASLLWPRLKRKG